ncbi:hypothetical protein NQ315_004019 [Exocentrus adspersus]|uniref:Uncharacterized protein n=1 Tax=Exocentrus adspersus TaxID=1586481 RepID=A0AAV8V7G8_9CUCU|nr:hypothetical protein NQ315_004019 [Exocentrus adspersus]
MFDGDLELVKKELEIREKTGVKPHMAETHGDYIKQCEKEGILKVIALYLAYKLFRYIMRRCKNQHNHNKSSSCQQITNCLTHKICKKKEKFELEIIFENTQISKIFHCMNNPELIDHVNLIIVLWCEKKDIMDFKLKGITLKDALDIAYDETDVSEIYIEPPNPTV